MKRILLSIMLSVFLVPTTHATLTFLPESDITGYSGTSTFTQNGVTGTLEFAVYDTSIQTISELENLEGYEDEQYIYAYQVFSTSIDAINSFTLFGFNPDAFTQDDMSSSDSFDGTTIGDAIGVTGTSLDSEKATWTFEYDLLVAGEDSCFLIIFSDYAPIAGTYEVNPADDDTLVPGDDSDDDAVPEPATLVLLLGGAVLSFKRK